MHLVAKVLVENSSSIRPANCTKIDRSFSHYKPVNIDNIHCSSILPGKFPVPFLHTVGIITGVCKEHLRKGKERSLDFLIKTKVNLKEDKELSTDGNGQRGEHVVVGGQAGEGGGGTVGQFRG